ncbi:organic cation transporter protein [Plakobranchus ocellatus]|uniref:Organic cation transporter protein n=1 Tax=Plakobranchus ocellatus TaxID=259542 RepID=A0AAV4B401_9GAST|nr:organic cation transporter protein [Plakobranchus ocellatus]
MVFQNRPHLAEIRVCNLSLQRHETSFVTLRQQQKLLLGRRLKSRINFYAGGNGAARMQQQQEQQQQQQQQPLPLVEISPFRKSVWRREKSLPDFYERRQTLGSQQQQRDYEKKQAGNKIIFNSFPNCSENKQNQQPVELTSTEMAARLATAVHGTDGDLGAHDEDPAIHNNHQGNSKSKCGTHPRAEFHHESTRLWRTQDLIPGFITRLERTKTSMLSFNRESSSNGGDYGFYLGEENNNNYLNYNSNSGNSSECGGPRECSSNSVNIKVKGGRMKQLIQRRPLLYLNPLDSYRQASETSRSAVHPWADYSQMYTQSKLETRNSFPLTSSRVRELMLSNSGHTTYPLRPVRYHSLKQHQQPDILPPPTACNSPHKFNSKLGAARNSLQVLSSLGTPTKLEKSLVAEYEMNLERFRRERLVMQPLDLRSVPSQYVSASMNLTRGELSLQEAREANRARRRKNLLMPLEGTASSTSSQLIHTDRSSLRSEGGDETGAALVLKKQSGTFVDPAMHPLDSVLAEESESHVLTEDDLGSASGINNMHVKCITKSAPGKMVKVSDGELRRTEEDLMFATTSSCDGKINYTDSNESKDGNVLPGQPSLIKADSLESDRALQKRKQREKDMDINLTLEDDGDLGCMHETTTPVSVGGSSTSRAKTNLEYLQKLRTKGAPRPLQPLPSTPLARDSRSNYNIEQKTNANTVNDVDIDMPSLNGQLKTPKQESLKNPSSSNGGLTKPSEKEKGSSESKDTATSKENYEGPLNNDQVSTLQNSQVNGMNQRVTGEEELVPQSAGKIDAGVNSCEETEPVIPMPEKKSKAFVITSGTPSEDEGFASPIKTNGQFLISNNETNVTVSEQQKVQPVAPDMPVPLATEFSLDEGENTVSAGPFLSAREDVVGETITPAGTPFTRGDSSTLAGTPLTNLDTSLEPFSETEGGHSTSADNGDSGVSTTFLTAEDSRNEILEGVVF